MLSIVSPYFQGWTSSSSARSWPRSSRSWASISRPQVQWSYVHSWIPDPYGNYWIWLYICILEYKSQYLTNLNRRRVFPNIFFFVLRRKKINPFFRVHIQPVQYIFCQFVKIVQFISDGVLIEQNRVTSSVLSKSHPVLLFFWKKIIWNMSSSCARGSNAMVVRGGEEKGVVPRAGSLGGDKVSWHQIHPPLAPPPVGGVTFHRVAQLSSLPDPPSLPGLRPLPPPMPLVFFEVICFNWINPLTAKLSNDCNAFVGRYPLLQGKAWAQMWSATAGATANGSSLHPNFFYYSLLLIQIILLITWNFKPTMKWSNRWKFKPINQE